MQTKCRREKASKSHFQARQAECEDERRVEDQKVNFLNINPIER